LYGSQPKSLMAKKWHQNDPGSNGREETSAGPLLLMIKVTYTILKKQTVEKLTSQARVLTIFIGFYCDMKPTSKTVVP
jgi:hypothetical protein